MARRRKRFRHASVRSTAQRNLPNLSLLSTRRLEMRGLMARFRHSLRQRPWFFSVFRDARRLRVRRCRAPVPAPWHGSTSLRGQRHLRVVSDPPCPSVMRRQLLETPKSASGSAQGSRSRSQPRARRPWRRRSGRRDLHHIIHVRFLPVCRDRNGPRSQSCEDLCR